MLHIEQEYLIYKAPALQCTLEVVVLRTETSSDPTCRNPMLKPLLKIPQVPSLHICRQMSVTSIGPCACWGPEQVLLLDHDYHTSHYTDIGDLETNEYMQTSLRYSVERNWQWTEVSSLCYASEAPGCYGNKID